MLVLRLFLVLTALLLVVSGGLYVLTGKRRYLDFVRRMFRFTVLVLMVFGLLYVLERYVLVGWKILL